MYLYYATYINYVVKKVNYGCSVLETMFNNDISKVVVRQCFQAYEILGNLEFVKALTEIL